MKLSRFVGRSLAVTCLLAVSATSCSEQQGMPSQPVSGVGLKATVVDGRSFSRGRFAGRLKVTATRYDTRGKASSHSVSHIPLIGTAANGQGIAYLKRTPTPRMRPAAFAPMESDTTAYIDGVPVLVFISDQSAATLTYPGSSDWVDDSGTQFQMNVAATSGNPNSYAEIYQNGELVASVSQSYSPVAGGWRLDMVQNTAYSGGSPAYSGSAEIEEEPVWEMTNEKPLARPLLKLVDNCVRAVGGFLAPKEAYAALTDPCRKYMVDVGLGVGGMVLSMVASNPFTFVLSGLHIANSMHAFARCKEAQRWAQ